MFLSHAASILSQLLHLGVAVQLHTHTDILEGEKIKT